MFGFYGDKLLYGVLSLDGQGLREFGPASAVIDEKYIGFGEFMEVHLWLHSVVSG